MSVPILSTSSTGSEMTNYARIGHAAQQLLPDILQELIAMKEPPHRLHNDVTNNKFLTRNLRADEWIMINNARTNGYADFDIPLIYKIVRNLNLIPPPTKGWDFPTPPTKTEITPGDDLERIRLKRNYILHRGNSKVTDQELTDFFLLFKDISARLETFLGKARGEFFGRFEDLEKRCMDERTEKLYLDRLEDIKKKEDDLSKVVNKLRKDLDSIMNNDLHQVEIEEWEEQNKLFVETNASEFVLKSLKEIDVFTVTGSSGIGKSATVHHVALLLRDTEGYNVIPCCIPSDIETYYRKDIKLLFVFDDICGKYAIVQSDVEEWTKRTKSIQNVLQKGKVKLLATCRFQVFQEEQFQRVKILSEKYCDLSSQKFSLSDAIKQQIAYQYLPNDVVERIKNRLHEFEFIPLIFELYRSSRISDQPIDPVEFFNNPFDIYSEEMNGLRDAPDKIKYCSLFLLVIHNGKSEYSSFTSEESTEARNRRENIFEECGIPRNTVRKRILEQLQSLSVLFLKLIGTTFTTIHDKVFDFLCSYFGKHLQSSLIRYADSTLIRDRTHLKSLGESKSEFLIEVEETNEEEYFKRLILDLSLGRSEDVFNHKQMVHYEYRTKFIHAVKNLNKTNVNQLLSIDRIKETILVQACIKNFYDIVKYIVDAGTNVNMVSCFDYNIPSRYIFWENLLKDCFMHSVDREVNANNRECNDTINEIYKVSDAERGITPLLIACYNGNEEIFEFLLDKGADVNIESSTGNTSLLIACYKNQTTIVQILLEAGADLNYARDDGFTSIAACACNKHFELMNILIDKGACVNTTFRDCNIPLLEACQNNKHKLIKLIIDKGADVNTTFFLTGETPLHHVSGDYNMDTFNLLLDKGANVNALDFIGETPLMVACIMGRDEFVKILLEKGAYTNFVRNWNGGETALMLACQEDDTRIVQLLLDHGADVNAANFNGTTTLIMSCYYSISNIVKLLLDSGADVNAASDDGTTPLKAASRSKNREIAKLIIEKRAGVKL